MKDFRKFCRPKIKPHSKVGDILIKLKCGETGAMSQNEYKKVQNFFKVNSFAGEDSPNSPGNILVINKEIDKQATFSTSDYDSIKDKFEIISIVGDKQDSAQTGDIICHSSILNTSSVFAYNDWIDLDDDWEFEGIYGVNTYTKTNTVVGDIVIKANNTITFINPSNWGDVNDQWEAVGIVGIESRNTPDGTVRILSLDYMDYNNPTTGNSGTGVYMYWGADGDITGLNNKTQVPCMSTSSDSTLTENVQRAVSYSRIPTDYFNVEESAVEGYKYTTISDGLYHPSMYLENGTINPDAIATTGIIPGTSTEFTINNASADFDGLNNTSKIMSSCTVNTPTNTYDTGNYPAAQCCSLYNKGNLQWYLPASGELACIISNFKKINTSRVTVGYSNYSYSSYYFWSSTLHSSAYARYVYGLIGYCNSYARSSGNTYYRVLAVSAF